MHAALSARLPSLLAAAALALAQACVAAREWVTYEGREGPGKGKHIVFVTGDEEYRSEEGMPMLAKILAERHGFKCTVLFAIDPNTGAIDPDVQTNIPGVEQLASADMMVMFLRFRELPDGKMKYIVDFLNSGKPILGLRTATHPFQYTRNTRSPYAKYDWRNKEFPGGFGQQVFGDTWISHHGHHGKESTRGVINPDYQHHPILKGVTDIWGPTDVYGVIHLPDDAMVLVHGQVLEGMLPTDKPVEGEKNDPMMPLIWVKTYTGEAGMTSPIIFSTIGAASDLESEDLRRLLVNSIYWGTGLEDQIPDRADVEYVGEFEPTYFGFGKAKKGVKPAELE